MGAWIETIIMLPYCRSSGVAPYMGAWIETFGINDSNVYTPSHPTWVRGLKQLKQEALKHLTSRTLHGCVD